MKLMIIESPGKKKKLQQILGQLYPGQTWRIEASVGHVRDLPSKGLEDGQLVTGVNADFTPVYELTERGRGVVAKLKKACAEASEIYLATDPDREGESISWHLQKCLGLKSAIRVSFNEINAAKVREAMAKPGKVDMPKVAAQEARRVLDRLVGYMVSPELKRQAGEVLSAGRVQSPAVRLVVEIERAIRAFRSTEHYGAQLHFAGAAGEWRAEWQTMPGFVTKEQPLFTDKAFAQLVANCKSVAVEGFEETEAKRTPPAPFTTSTLQQAASNALRLDPKAAMKVAQSLYEQGHISYHRTDNPNVSDDAMPEIRAVVASLGLEMVGQRRTFKSKDGAQEGHPAITPTHWEIEVAGETPEEQALYRLIRIRALASQLVEARYAVRTLRLRGVQPIDGKSIAFMARGRTLTYQGWLKLLANDDTAEKEEKAEESPNPIPELQPGTVLTPQRGELQIKTTKAPSRYTKASLVKALEAHGIGRPATYAAIMDNIESRGYVQEQKRFLVPTPTGEKIVDALVGNFAFVDLGFTSGMEDDLDRIAGGQASAREVIQRLHAQLAVELAQQQDKVPTQATPEPAQHACPDCSKPLRRIKGSNGFFWGCTGHPECKTTLPNSGGKPGKKKVVELSAHACRECGKPLIHRQKKGKNGYDFWGCSGFSAGCKASYKNANGAPAFD